VDFLCRERVHKSIHIGKLLAQGPNCMGVVGGQRNDNQGNGGRSSGLANGSRRDDGCSPRRKWEPSVAILNFMPRAVDTTASYRFSSAI
jgi:hypothetical protein